MPVRGSTYRSPVTYETVTAPTTPLVDVLDPDGVVLVTDAPVTMTGGISGAWPGHYDYAIPIDAPLGTYTAHFTGDGEDFGNDTFLVTAAVPVPATESLICSSWASIDDVCGDCADIDSDLLDRMLLAASEALYVLSGRQFRGGGCEATVRPSFPCGVDYGPCGGPYEILLPHYPVTEIIEVKVRQTYGGELETLDPSQYELVNHSTLVRLQDSDGVYRGWPQQEIRQTSNGTGRYFEVSYAYGIAPPSLGVTAAADLACEFALACDSSTAGKCKLPKNAQSVVRQGVSQEFIDVTQFLAEDLMGVFAVDNFLRIFNKNKLRRRATVWSPDLPSFRTVPFGGS